MEVRGDLGSMTSQVSGTGSGFTGTLNDSPPIKNGSNWIFSDRPRIFGVGEINVAMDVDKNNLSFTIEKLRGGVIFKLTYDTNEKQYKGTYKLKEVKEGNPVGQGTINFKVNEEGTALTGTPSNMNCLEKWVLKLSDQ